MVTATHYKIDDRQSAYTVPVEQTVTTYAYCWTPGYVEQILFSLVRDIGSDVATIGLTPERLEAILERVRAREFRARYGA